MKNSLKLSLALILAFCTISVWAENSFSITVSTSENVSTFTITRTDASIEQRVFYRTVSSSALAGKHYTPVYGVLTFNAGQTTKTVQVNETAVDNIDLVYRYQNITTRRYYLEVLDATGTKLAERTRIITYGNDYKFNNTYVNRNGNNLVYFNIGDETFKSSTSKYVDVAHPATVATYLTIDDSYNYDNRTLCNVSTDALFNKTDGSRAYLNAIGDKMYATVCFTEKEKDDGYQYIQILADNSTTYDGYDDNGDITNGPSVSLYKACFELSKSGGHEANDHHQFFPHKTDCHKRGEESSNTITEFAYFDTYLYKQAFKSESNNRPSEAGALMLAPTVNTINVRFDAAGDRDDTWYVKDLFVRLAIVDKQTPRIITNSITVSEGIYMQDNLVYISIPFSEIVNYTGDTRRISTTWGTMNYHTGSGTNVLTFYGTINATPSTTLRITGLTGTIKDMSDNEFTWSGTINLNKTAVSYYTISYNLDGGTATNPTKYNSNCLAFTLNNPTREGYTFLGWTGSNGSTPQTTVTISPLGTGNKSFTANWESNVTYYNISYNLNEGEMPSGISNPEQYTDNDSFTLNNPVREGYFFTGWTGSNGDKPQTTVTIEAGTTGNLSFTANWTDSWDGEGTQENPYIISYDEQFLLLANKVNANELEVPGSYFKLGADITFGTEQEPDTTMVGFSKSRRFYGHLDGDGHTLNVYMVRNKNFAAPFGIADGSTFTNLNIEGTIITDHKFAGGIASYVYGKYHGPVNVTNCTSNIHIISNVTVPSNHDGTHAGFVGQCEEGTINFENCVFTGSVVDPVVPHQTIKCAGFLGWVNDAANYTNCLQAGTIDVESYMATFQRNKKGASISYTNAYYINGFNDNQGTQASGIIPENSIVKKYLINATPYYIPGTEISGINANYFTDGTPVTVTPVVTYFSNELIKNTDYTVSFKIKEGNDYNTVTQITEAGDYKIIITGAGDYVGTYTTRFKVVAITNDWSDLQSLLNVDGVVILSKDYIANNDDKALEVNGDVKLDMNGHTIDRNVSVAKEEGYVIKVSKGASLNIVDDSKDKTNVITGGNNIGNGGGIYNEGTLTIENINISGNQTIRDSKVYGTGAGIYSTGTLSVTNCNVSNNVGDGGGGGIHALGELTISGGNVSGNKTVSKGAGIRVTGNNSTITGCTISNNSMIAGANAKNGGGIFVDGTNGLTNLTLTGCTITSNTATDNGGGIYITNGNVIAKDCTISNNNAKTGYDIYLYQNCTINIEGSTTTTNTSANDIFAYYPNTQIIVPTNSTFLATIQKSTVAWDEDQKTGWCPISSPISEQLFTNVTNMLSTTHNIYRYDPEHTMWQEYRAESNIFDKFETGRGYLYRRAKAATLTYSGTLNSGDVNYNLAYTEGNDLKSYNLIGNPYSHNIYKGVNISNEFLEEKYCILNANGTWQVMDDSEVIPVGTAILVQATEAKTLEITSEATFSKERSNNDNIWFTVSNNEFKDKACIEFKNGHGFNKVAHRNEDAPMLYINHNGENFASVDLSDDTELVNLNFKTNKTGKFTLSYKANGMFSYLHLIDKLTGADVDLLLDEEYSFIASSKDDESRFIVRMNYQTAPNNSGDHFAYQSGSDIVVDGEGTLQIFDLMGRMVMITEIHGTETLSTSVFNTGVYVLKLNGKTQKIVVR